jgi:hypothetical protein
MLSASVFSLQAKETPNTLLKKKSNQDGVYCLTVSLLQVGILGKAKK